VVINRSDIAVGGTSGLPRHLVVVMDFWGKDVNEEAEESCKESVFTLVTKPMLDLISSRDAVHI
jgi:hypothetical protein